MDNINYQLDLLSAMNERIKADEKMYRLVCSSSSNAFIYVNLEDRSARPLGNFDRFFKDLSIRNSDDLSKLYTYFDETSVPSLRDLIYLERNDLESDSKELLMSDKKTYLECEALVVSDDSLYPTDKVIRFRDITKYKTQNEELRYMAYYDGNTGLYSRNYFVSLLADYVRRAESSDAVVSVMFIDIDGFHIINDGMGLVIGDEVVQYFGRMLAEFSDRNVIVSHFNADVYCIAIFDPGPVNNAKNFFERLKEKTKAPLRLSNGSEITLSFSAGVADYPEAAKNTLDLINCAEIVMLKAKKTGRGQLKCFDSETLENFLNNAEIENKLKEAVFNQNFQMNFQPQYYADSMKLRGVEALIRWKDADGKMIAPSSFIPIAEMNGSIVPIGKWVLEESIKIYSDWKKRYNTDMILSLNVSAIQYRSDDFVDSLFDLIKKYDVDTKDIELEITESVFIDDMKDVTDKLMILREYGIRISLDDFGTGYSSLSYLKGLPIDTIKIDKSFVDTINTDENSRIILDTVLYMSKKLKLETIAEGVEDKDQLDYLKNAGCDCIQGFYLGKPMNKEGINDLLEFGRN